MNKKSAVKVALAMVLSSLMVCTPVVAASTGPKNNPSDGEDVKLTVKQQIEQEIWQEIDSRESKQLEAAYKLVEYIQANASEDDYAFVSNMGMENGSVVISVPNVESRKKISNLLIKFNDDSDPVVSVKYVLGKYNLSQLKNFQEEILKSEPVVARKGKDLMVKLEDDIITITTYVKDTQIENWIKNYKNNDCIMYYYSVTEGTVPPDYKNNPA